MALTHIGMMNLDSYQAPLANRKQGDERDAIIPAARVIPPPIGFVERAVSSAGSMDRI